MVRSISTWTAIGSSTAFNGVTRLIGHRLNVHLYDDRLDCFLGSTRLLTLRRGRPPQASGKHNRVLDYHHVIHALRKKPNGVAQSGLPRSAVPANKRIATEIGTEYDNLKPVADLLARLSEEVSRFLNNPGTWHPRAPDDAALSSIRQQVYTDLHRIAERRLVQDHLDDWRAAYDLRGKNSTFGRAQEINAIYEAGAPIASTVMNPSSPNSFRKRGGLSIKRSSPTEAHCGPTA
jgi:hypothetical protein